MKKFGINGQLRNKLLLIVIQQNREQNRKKLNKKKNAARTTLKSKGDFPKGDKKIEEKIFATKKVTAAD